MPTDALSPTSRQYAYEVDCGGGQAVEGGKNSSEVRYKFTIVI